MNQKVDSDVNIDLCYGVCKFLGTLSYHLSVDTYVGTQ